MAEEIRVLLARRGMTATGLARQIGMRQPYMSRRMTGEIAFDLDDLEHIAPALGVRVSDLLELAERDLGGSVTGQYPRIQILRSGTRRATHLGDFLATNRTPLTASVAA